MGREQLLVLLVLAPAKDHPQARYSAIVKNATEPGDGVAKYVAGLARSNQQIQNNWPGRLAPEECPWDALLAVKRTLVCGTVPRPSRSFELRNAGLSLTSEMAGLHRRVGRCKILT
jgi:hypothetical protein